MCREHPMFKFIVWVVGILAAVVLGNIVLAIVGFVALSFTKPTVSMSLRQMPVQAAGACGQVEVHTKAMKQAVRIQHPRQEKLEKSGSVNRLDPCKPGIYLPPVENHPNHPH